MGKGAVNETLPNYGGVYAGNGSHDDVAAAVEHSDLVLYIGAIKSDFNTAGFTFLTSSLNTIDFHSNYIKVKYSEFHGLRMNGVLRKVAGRLGKLSVTAAPTSVQTIPEDDKPGDQTITHAWFWPRFREFVQENDIIVTETGTSGYVRTCACT